MTADTLLSTKLHIPPPRANMVTRAHLVARVAEGLRLGRRLTLVSAPPGFGKTALIQEWVAATPRRAAWLSIDEGDNDAARFVRYVSAALARVDERIGRAPPDASAAQAPQELLIALINDLAETGAELLLVLDDYHSISEFAVHELVAFLLANQPISFHVVIGTREDPPLPLARLRARDQVTEIRERALRFTPEEAAAFLNQTMDLGLSPPSIASLTARTEGWITGLQLAGLALRQLAVQRGASTSGQRFQSADDFVVAFAGDDRYVVDYLMAEVLDREPEAVRSFLQQTSILDRLSAPLCNALTDRNDSQAMLEHLEGANLFLVLLDNRREWYRYHVLFAEVLRLTLTIQERIELHKRAAQWFAAQGLDGPALQHTRLAAEMVPTSSATTQAATVDQPLIEPLSERELEVLRLIADGFSNAEIAQRLIIAHGTVKRHTNNIYGKLGVQSRTQAVARSRELGLL
jgi:LuxR family maltose regulon positive regulatory protein